MHRPILQSSLGPSPLSDPVLRRLPGMRPLAPERWILVDDTYAGQMAERDRLIAQDRGSVLRVAESALPATQELLDELLAHLAGRGDFAVGASAVRRPDGVIVALDRTDPLGTAARLVQEDLCLLERRGQEHVLTAAALLFPASWDLSEKFGRPLLRIHAPVPEYTEQMARRVQRLFDALHADRPLWRANLNGYADAALYQPHREGAPRPPAGPGARYIRSERQCLIRLRRTGAVVFSIHTTVVARASLTPEEEAVFRESFSEAEET